MYYFDESIIQILQNVIVYNSFVLTDICLS